MVKDFCGNVMGKSRIASRRRTPRCPRRNSDRSVAQTVGRFVASFHLTHTDELIRLIPWLRDCK